MDKGLYSESALASELDGLKGSSVYLWLQEQLEVNSTSARSIRDEVQIRWLQGQAQCLVSLIESIDEAEERSRDKRETARRYDELKAVRNKQF